MTFLSILCALVFEQLKPLRADNPLYSGIKSLALRVEGWFNAGQADHGRLGWFVMVGALTIPTMLVYWICISLPGGWLAALAWNIVIVYVTLGFRHYSHYFTSIQLALNAGDEAAARMLLGEWTKQDTSTMNVNEIARIAVEKALTPDADLETTEAGARG